MPAPKTRRRPWFRRLVLLLVLVIVAAATSGVYSARVARYVPFLGGALHALAPLLPADVAWLHDRGTVKLRPGVYFGWSDGRRGELHLYGEGCSGAAGGEVVSLILNGPDGSWEFGGSSVEHLRTNLDRARPHPHLRLSVIADRTLSFDRATLRCRDGTEARARIAATVVFVPPASIADTGPGTPVLAAAPSEASPPPLAPDAAPRATIYGPSPFPGLGIAGEYTVLTAHRPLLLKSIAYAPSAASTSTVLGAAGHPQARANWRQAAVAPANPAYREPGAGPLTPWHLGYQSATDPRAFRSRPAHELDLLLEPTEAAMLFITRSAFRRTPVRRPVILRPLIEYEHGGEVRVLVSPGLAFGWTEEP